MLGRDARPPPPQPTDGIVRSVQIEPLTEADVPSAVEFAVRVLRVKPGDLGEQFASDITDDLRHMFRHQCHVLQPGSAGLSVCPRVTVRSPVGHPIGRVAGTTV